MRNATGSAIRGAKLVPDREKWHGPIRLTRRDQKGKEKVQSVPDRLGPAALSGLLLCRDRVAEVVESEQMKLQQARHDVFRRSDNLTARLKDEKEKLRMFQRKAAEEGANVDRMLRQYKRAHDALYEVRSERSRSGMDENKPHNAFTLQMCEHLVSSWSANLATARARQAPWEFKCNRQVELVSKVATDLDLAKTRYNQVREQIDGEVDSLKAALDFLRHL